MANKRIYYPVEQVCIAPIGTTSYTTSHLMHGLQSIGVETNFNLEQVFELGQIAIYENIEDIPDISCTMEKVLDGYPLIYHQATRGAPTATLAGRQNQRSIVVLGLFSDQQDSVSGAPLTEVSMSGLYVSSLSYTVPVEGSATESVTLVGNHKIWKNSAFLASSLADALNLNTDTPLAISGSGGVQRREDIIFYATGVSNLTDVNGAVIDTAITVLPPDIRGISSSGTNNRDANADFGAHIQTITVSADLGREAIYELGRRAPYHRFATFPVEVSCEVEVVTTEGDYISATEEGINADGTNLTDRTIHLRMREGTRINLGTKCKLSGVSQSGGGTDGGNMTVSYSFTTYNTMTVQHPQDPTTGLRIPTGH